MAQPNGKEVRPNDRVVYPNEKVVRPNDPSYKSSVLGSKRNYVPPQWLTRRRGQRLADLYSSKRQATTTALTGVGADSTSSKRQATSKSFIGASRNVLKSIQVQNNQSRRPSTRYDSDDDVDGTSLDPLFAPPRRNNVEAWYSSSESIYEDNNDDELHSLSKDEDMHIRSSNENIDDGQPREANAHRAEQDFQNRIELSETIQRDVNVSGSSTTKKRSVKEKKRGRNKCKEIAKLKPNEKLDITFYNNRAVGPNHKTFARHLGIIVRDTNMCPVRVHKWTDIGDKEKEHMWTDVTDVFTNESMNTYKEYVFGHMRELWTKWRSDLLRYNVTKKKITLEVAAKGKPPTGLEESDWKWLISEIYSKSDFKEKSARNSINRGHYARELMHRTGSKPIRQVIWDDLGANKGNIPKLVDVFYETRKKGTNLPNAETTQKYDEIRQVLAKEPSLTHVEVAKKVFKSKSRDRVVCFGGGITLKQINGPQPSIEQLQAELNSTRRQNQILTNRVDTVQEENNELKGRMDSYEAQLKVFKDFLVQQLNVSIQGENASNSTEANNT